MAASGAVSLGLTAVRVRISSKVRVICTPQRLPAPPAHFTQRRNSRTAGGDHQARWAGARGGEASELEVLERRCRGLAVGDAYRRRGEREARCCSGGVGDADIGRQWRVWWRSGERERWWRGLALGDAYRGCGRREAWCRSWGEENVDMGRPWYARWRSWELERRERGPGGSWQRPKEGERRK